MSIKFFSSTSWSADPNVNVNLEKLHLQTILPKVGELRLVSIGDGYYINENMECNLLWQPPYSESNGYNDQPSELLNSYIISGKAFLNKANE
jgi:hypothetical protein